MTEWEKYKVVDLKEECKTRQISITGLKLKQQYIDKLVEYESSNSQDAAPAEESVAEKTNGAIEEVAKDDVPKQSIEQQSEGSDGARQQSIPDVVPQIVETDENLPQDRPVALKMEDSKSLEVMAAEQKDPARETAEEAKDVPEDVNPDSEAEQFVVADKIEETNQLQEENTAVVEPEQIIGIPVEEVDAMDEDTAETTHSLRESISKSEPEPTSIVDKLSETDAPDSDSKKRKRRSNTPSVEPEEISKKAKSLSGGAVSTKRGSQSPTISKAGKDDSSSGQFTHQPGPKKEATADEDPGALRSTDRSPSVGEEEIVEPALHAATRSLYLKNFKRPLNIQTLRSHIRTVAQGTAAAVEEDPIKFFNVNNIRSHAFVTFSSITAASRVRAAMHQTRFPNEPQRDPLWVDFIPDEKVEDWVEQETGGTRAMGRNSAAKLEVTYEDNGDGFEAVFQEAYPSRGSRPSLATSMNHGSAVSQRQASYSADPTRTSAIASGIHPDRAPLVPRSPKSMRKDPPVHSYEPQQRSEDRGHGFTGLDDIFSSTQSKPKLYYKVPSQDIIDDRLEIIKDLYSDRGVSGQPGMKRYTFEKNRGRDEWVDNGPEFGHGKRGQDRLAGIGGRGRGGFRGRGGRGNHYNGDSYRGGGRR